MSLFIIHEDRGPILDNNSDRPYFSEEDTIVISGE